MKVSRAYTNRITNCTFSHQRLPQPNSPPPPTSASGSKETLTNEYEKKGIKIQNVTTLRARHRRGFQYPRSLAERQTDSVSS
ncbi:hypothetical protein J6590_081312 [Homalodisca vitripennis]|nr:hypothetical protein J6590_081312 [Homalodisca vitripennis]